MKALDLFCEIHPPLDLKEARIEAQRCYYCYDAPCIQACPTEIDIPSFIRKISNGNIKGSALDILGANIMGGTCARACPVEVLCQKACVREHSEGAPVKIGQLQRFATDEYFKLQEQPFVRAPLNGHSVAVVGGGPAGLSCAHRLVLLGYEVTIYEARDRLGGLNEFGLAPYKVTPESVDQEIEFILSIGSISVQLNQELGKNLKLEDLEKKYAAVFLAVGLSGRNRLNIPGEELPGVFDAASVIDEIRQATRLKKKAPAMASEVIVIGGGNTAIDMAIQAKMLGASQVTLAYRKGQESMGATVHEQELAQKQGVQILPWAQPLKIESQDGLIPGAVSGVQFKIAPEGSLVTLRAQQVYKAIGQSLNQKVFLKSAGMLEQGRIKVSDDFETPRSKIFAGGDCVAIGENLTVTAVQQGKLAAQAIHKKLSGGNNG